MIEITLPFPPRGLSPNSRLGWRAKAQVVRLYREDVGWTAAVKWTDARPRGFGVARKPLEAPVEATVTFVVPDRRRRDLDNLLAMLKPAWDGLVDAGVLAGDDAAQFKVVDANVVVRHDRWVPLPESRLVVKSQPCVIVVLRGSQ